MTRLFLNQSARESLLKTGRATWRKKMEPQPTRNPSYAGGWVYYDGRATTAIESFNDGMYLEHTPYPPGREYWCAEKFGISGNGAYFPSDCDGTVRHAWHPPTKMKHKYARLHVRVISVRVVRDGEWWWEIDFERIKP